MVRDGIHYALGLFAVAVVVGWLASPAWAALPLLLAAFFLWFFRDPEREIPGEAGLIVSPADGKVTDVSTIEWGGAPRKRISIFLNVFDVHVNRSPIAGVIASSEYRRGKFGNAMGAISSEQNEQNIVTVNGEGQTLVFKQIAGLLARRVVFTKKIGDPVARGERIGLMKFSSRMDVIMEPTVALRVKVGDRVRGGSTVLADFQPAAPEAVGAGSSELRENGKA
ncbi:MAG TPA: phosphatidylserine decarboxylase [Terriglobales bacterium]|nr:phosphatidylserine decarboxylase [Terriglobales bacterium]